VGGKPAPLELPFGVGKLRLTVYSPSIVRVTHIPAGSSVEESLAVIRSPGETPSLVEERDGLVLLSTDRVAVLVDRDRATVEFMGGRDVAVREVDRCCSKVAGAETYSFRQVLELRSGDSVYGLGQHAGYSAQTGFDYRGRTVYLAQRNTDIAIPFMVSSGGYGILWDVYSMGVLSFRGDRLEAWFEASRSLDYYFIYGPEIDKVIGGYRWLTGKAPIPPKYAFGYWQSKERYATQEEIVSVVREFRRRGIPLDVIVQDWRYWGKYGWNAFRFDEDSYPDPAGMVEAIHSLNARLAISIWPMFGSETEIYREAEREGVLIPGTGLVNFFSDRGREFFWRKVRDVFFRIGVDGYWLDATEPEIQPMLIYTTWHHDLDIGGGRRFFEYLNAFPLLETKAVYEGQRRETDRRVLILTRSAFAGQQRNSAISWSGDVTGDWTTFRSQVWAGLNFCLSGIPYWTTDTGGFFSGNPETGGYRELFIRWLQWSVFCPVLRVHGTYFPKEPWRFGPEAEEIIARYIRLRYRLLPYIYSLAWRVYSEDYTMMRALVMDFREDEEALRVDDQFMFGPFIMVSPVTTPSTRERRVYLPRGLWYDFWTGRTVAGGRYITSPSPLDTIPLHVKAGGILPMSPPAQHSGRLAGELELRVFPGADGEFLIYEDDGETYAYERGEYAVIPVKWLDGEGRLIIGDKAGSYELPELRLKVVWVREGVGVGLEEAKPDAEVVYRGRSIAVERPRG